MTREEAIKELQEDIDLYMPETWVESVDRDTPDGRLITALEMAIQALEKEPFMNKPCVSAGVCEHDKIQMLDNLRAEIGRCGSIMVAYAITKDTKTDKGIENLVKGVVQQAKEQVLKIIDKYRTESEND